MPIIHLKTDITAPIERVFDLSLCMDLHKATMSNHREIAVAGVTTGLIGLGESVTWRAKHFGVWTHLTVGITALDPPRYFRDSMIKGAFKRFDHHHYFEPTPGGTRMIDYFDYTAPLGILGYFADALFLKAYTRALLIERNRVIKAVAESDEWRTFLDVEASQRA